MYESVTHAVRVVVTPTFVMEKSEPEDSRWFWSYRVEITNFRPEAITLRSRHWVITDGLGRVQEVRGPGVVGEEPSIASGATFEYTSGCPLGTPSGFMVGSYRMQGEDGAFFEVAIPAFSLDTPDVRRVVN
jgi:ApaG protein